MNPFRAVYLLYATIHIENATRILNAIIHNALLHYPSQVIKSLILIPLK